MQIKLHSSCNMKILHTIIFFVGSFSISADAQSQNDTTNPSPYSIEFLQNVFEESKFSANTKDALADVPNHVVYKYAFKSLLRNPVLLSSLPMRDQQQLLHLPGHNSDALSKKNDNALLNICTEYTNSSSVDASSIVNFAANLDELKWQYYTDLDTHYERIYDRLSATTKLEIEDIIYKLTTGTNIAFSTVSMEGIAKKAPLFSTQLFDTFCESLPDTIAVKRTSTKNALLINEEIPFLPSAD